MRGVSSGISTSKLIVTPFIFTCKRSTIPCRNLVMNVGSDSAAPVPMGISPSSLNTEDVPISWGSDSIAASSWPSPLRVRFVRRIQPGQPLWG